MIRKLLVLLLCLTAATATAKKPKSSASKKAESSAEKPKESDYDKLFKEKHTVADGMFRLHDVKGKLYFEIPDSLFGREMLLGSTISEVSDNAAATTGSKSDYPLHVVFTRNDRSVQLRTVNCENITDETGASRALAEAVKRNTADPILRNYKIEAWNRDSTAVVVNVTDLFVADVEEMSPFSKYGLYTAFELKKTFQKERSMLGEIKAFSDNVVVRSTLSYIFTLTRGRTTLVKDQPLTAVMTRSLVLLPREPYRPRITDSRMSVFPTGKVLFSEREQRAKVIYYAHRWRLEPSDMDAWKRGERVAPKKQIVFYVDDGFPEMWKKHIFEAVDQWNEPFGRIGFKNAIAAKPYPKDDPEFDPDNIKYSCIRYAPIAIANAMGPSWVDPATGEIINASILICNDVIRLAAAWRFLQTAQVDERVRTADIPEELLMETLSGVAAHEAGHCLGLMHNMAASSAFPTDSLRSAAFTRKYGITPSIMDYARFNYVAQPGDKGVRLAPSDLGVYDYYAIEWLYRWYPGDKSVREEQAEGEKLIDAKEGDPMYRYAPQQVLSRYDPSAVEEDLGDDAVKSGAYGVSNLKLIAAGMDDWIGNGDPDYKLRKDLFRKMVDQYHRYIYTAMHNVGGIRLDNSRRSVGEGTRFVSTPASVQEASLRWVLRELSDCDWLVMKAHATGYPLGYYQNYMQETLFESMRKRLVALCAGVTLSSYLAQEEPFTVGDYLDVVYEELWENVVGQKPLTPSCRIMQRHSIVLLNSKIKAMGGHALFMLAYAPDDADLELFGLDRAAAEESASLGKGYGWQPTIDVAALDETETAFFTLLTKLRTLLTERMPRVAEDEKTYYRAMLYSVEQMIGSRNLK